MVSPKETILGLDIITVREKKKTNKPRLHYPTLTISTVINIYKDRKHHYKYTLREHISHYRNLIYVCSGYKKVIKVTASPTSADL